MIANLDYSWNDVFERASFEQRAGLHRWRLIVEQFTAAPDKDAAAIEIREKFGVPQSTLYRRIRAFRENGPAALLPAGARRRIAAAPSTLPPAFVSFWQVLCEENQRKIAPAYRSLFFDHLLAERTIPGYGETGQGATWRGIYAAEHPGWSIPEECPYRPYDATPNGWSEATLRRYAPDKYCLTAARIGRAAASEYLPKVPTTRVGLRFGQVFVMDDVYHDTKVTFAGNREAQIVVELGALELLSGHYCSYGLKPVREKDDGGREVLREAYLRYLLADIAVRIGVCQEGALIAGEHGTARAPASVLAVLNRWFGREMIRFEAGGLRHAPIARGLFEGRPGGNFRFKAALESHHNLKKNELAQLPGAKGKDPEHAPEDLATKEAYHRTLVKACSAVADRPDLVDNIRSPFPSYWQYAEAVALLYDRIADRKNHSLEGFDECGLTMEEFRLSEAQAWAPLADLVAEASDQERAAIYALIQADKSRRYNRRVMSPREAFAHSARTQNVVRLPEAAVPEILGPELGRSLPVDVDQTLRFEDPYIAGKVYGIAAIARTARGDFLLERGAKYLIHLSPIDARFAYVSTAAGVFIGKAPVLLPGSKADVDAARRNLAIVREVESIELRRLLPVAAKRLREAASMSANNAEVLRGIAPETGTGTNIERNEEEEYLAALAEQALAANVKGGMQE